MGVSLKITAYQKEKSCIVGQISFLGLYEVKLDSIQPFQLESLSIQHYQDLYLITEISGVDVREFELLRGDLQFYYMATNYFSDQSLGTFENESTGLMFHPDYLLGPVTRLLEAKDYILDYIKRKAASFVFDEIHTNKEIEFLQSFKSLLEAAIKKDAMVGIVFG